MDLKRVELDEVISNTLEVIEEEEEEHFHVLAVDDSLIDRKLLEKLLTLSSYHVTCVESGDKALEYLGLVDKKDHKDNSSTCSPLSSSSKQEGQGSKVNLIMTDYSMPGMNGYDLLKRVKGSTWKDVPVIVMSSENVPSRINMCLEGGAKEFLLKPVKLSDLRKLQSHLSCENNIFIHENENKREDGDNEDNNKDNIANKRKEITEKRPLIKELNV